MSQFPAVIIAVELTVRIFLLLSENKARSGCQIYWIPEGILTLQRGVTGTARMLHALTHSSISRQVREQM